MIVGASNGNQTLLYIESTQRQFWEWEWFKEVISKQEIIRSSMISYWWKLLTSLHKTGNLMLHYSFDSISEWLDAHV